MRRATAIAASPTTTQSSWRSKNTHDEPYARNASTEDDESTMTSPMTSSSTTRANSERCPDAAGRAFRRACDRTSVLDATTPPGEGVHLGGEVVAPLGVGPVPVERRACRREQDHVAGPRCCFGGF